MKWNVIKVMVGMFVAMVFGLTGCGGGGGGGNDSNSNSTVQYTLILNNNEPTGFTYYSLKECDLGRAQAMTLQSVWSAECRQK